MMPFAVIAAWDDRDFSAREAEQLLGPIRGWCEDGVATTVVPGAAAAAGATVVCAGDSAVAAIYADRERRRLFVGDVRLYDRAGLIGSLGTAAEPGDSDLRLLARAFDRFGWTFAKYVVGDFSLVVWDWTARTLHAVRDHFGLRPLYYRLFDGGIALASDVRQLLVLPAGPPPVDPQTALDYLLFRYAHHGRTFFRDIRQIWPAHALIATQHDLLQHRYWVPPDRVARTGRDEEWVEEWRRLFRIAVRDRLRSSFPVGSYLSGGLDSASIVGAAHDVYMSEGHERPPFITASAQFPGLDCDETPYIDAVAQRSSWFESFRWNATEANRGDFENPSPAMPRLREGIGRAARTEIPAMRARGVRVMLAGTGGDELGWSHGVFKELLLRGRWGTLTRELAAWGSIPRAWMALRTNMTGFRLRTLPADPPDWLGPELAAIFPGAPPDVVADRFHVQSPTLSETWRALHLPQTAVPTDVSILTLAEGGLELRLPYRDLRLVELVLRMPVGPKLPRGDMRRLQREAVAPFLPLEVLERRTKSRGDSAVAHQIRANLTTIRSLFRDRNWASAPYVNQRAMRRLLDRLIVQDREMRRTYEWNLVWTVGVFESWLRQWARL